ncbi:SatD family protein [Streptococcus uberis]|uniref:SatD family protein n=1 Tax=Streptococcus uberis TaxID=1349 RepID=UPI001FF30304|nr:SatD family protein [Streptococcus uberis]MCK1221764.1 SatD family protein [Streptococcus uberis]
MNYIAVIGDFIDSKQVEQRYQFQEKFKKALEKINQKYQKDIVSKFSITLGDEFQGLLKIEANVFQMIDDISLAMKPHSIRYGIGIGQIITEINPEMSIGADGPAYWQAREAITYIHQKNDYGQTKIAIRTEDLETDVVINALISAGDAIKSNWRASQEEVFETILHLNYYQENFDQKEVSEKLGLTASSLSKRLKSSSVKVYFRTRNAAKELLNKLRIEGNQNA